MFLVKSCLKSSVEVRREVLEGQPVSHVVLCYVKTYVLNFCFVEGLIYSLLLTRELACFQGVA